jgi:hypothetical protein
VSWEEQSATFESVLFIYLTFLKLVFMSDPNYGVWFLECKPWLVSSLDPAMVPCVFAMDVFVKREYTKHIEAISHTKPP